MSSRTFDAVQKEYSETCGQIGHLEFQVELLQAEIFRLRQKRSELNKEAADAPKEAAAEASEATSNG